MTTETKIIAPAETYTHFDGERGFFTITGSATTGYMVVKTELNLAGSEWAMYSSQNMILDKKLAKGRQHVFKTLKRAELAVRSCSGMYTNHNQFGAVRLAKNY